MTSINKLKKQELKQRIQQYNSILIKPLCSSLYVTLLKDKREFERQLQELNDK